MLAAALVVLLLVLGVAACGGGSDSDSTTATTEQQSQAGGDQEPGGGDSSSEGSDSGDAGDFVPEQHDDSGGGSEQFKVKGGDNSVQEFGEEAGEEEFEAAAAALHNFLDGRAEDNWAAACQYMSEGIIESFEKLAAQTEQLDGASCGAILSQLTNPAAKQSLVDEAAEADIRSLRIGDGRAFLIYTGSDGVVMAMPMADEDGDWKVASLAGTPLS